MIINRGQDDTELIATEAGDSIGITAAFSEPAGKLDNGRITKAMTIIIIDLFKTIHIDHHNTGQLKFASGLRDSAAKMIKK